MVTLGWAKHIDSWLIGTRRLTLLLPPPQPARGKQHTMHTHMLNCFSCVWLFATPWTVTCQALLAMGFSRHEYWSGFPWSSFSKGSSQPRDGTHISYISCIGRRVLYHYCHLGNHTLHTSPQILTIKIVLRKQLERVQGFLSISCPGFLVWCLSLKCYTFFTMILCQ